MPDQSTTPPPVAEVTLAAGLGRVWVDTRSHIYHFPVYRWYGTTIQGEYLSELDTVAKGNRAALNERRPPSSKTQERRWSWC